VRGKNLVNDWRPLAGVHIQLLRLPLKLPEVVEHDSKSVNFIFFVIIFAAVFKCSKYGRSRVGGLAR
jgi:hypothetical protein